MPITLKDISDRMTARLRDSAAILALADEVFDLPHRIYVGATGPSSPEAADGVGLSVTWDNKSLSPGSDFSYTFHVWCSFKLDTVATETVGGVIVTTYSGQQRLEDFLDLACKEIVGDRDAGIPPLSSQLDWTDVTLTIDPEVIAGVWVGRLTMTAQVANPIGGELSL